MLGRTIAHYQMLEELGRGGMGQVYRARDLRLGREVAVKILPSALAQDPDRLGRFEREARAVAALQHPNIVTIHSVEESDGIHFLTMELVEGEGLESRISGGGLPLSELLELAVPLADAIRAIHDRGITHRDLKPSNIMISRDGPIKVLDFGLAELLPEVDPADLDDRTTAEMTPDGRLFGTIPYSSPEQLQGRTVDRRADVFSLGIVLYEMATGRRPFLGETQVDVISSILRDHPRPLPEVRPDLPDRLGRILARCLQKDPSRRPSAIVLYEELESMRREQGDLDDQRVPSIAVLPFVDMSPDKDQGYFCEGIAEELINSLAKVRELHVASRTSAFRYMVTTLDIREIGRELGVETILEGSVRKAGDRLRITAQLIKVADGYHLWSERYDRDMRDVFAIQDEISRNIVQALRVTLSPGETKSLVEPHTTDVQAYDYYLRGRKFFYQYRRRGMELSLKMFSLAIEHDPRYARAYAGIADARAFLFLYADHSPAGLTAAEEASRKALELEPELAEAHASRGQILSLSHQDEEAEIAFERAIQLGPRLFEAYYLYARHTFAAGDLEKSAFLFEKAAELNPGDYQSPLLVAQIYDDLKRVDAATAARRRGVKLVEERLAHHPEDVRAIYMGANGLVALGEKERGLEWADLAVSMEPDEPMVLYNVACVHSLAGEIEPAITYLERSVAAGLAQKSWFQHDANLHPLRRHPRFIRLMEALD